MYYSLYSWSERTRAKDSKISVKIKDSNVSPLSPYTSLYGKDENTKDENIILMIIDILEGNFHPTKSLCKPGKIGYFTERAYQIQKRLCPSISFDNDSVIRKSGYSSKRYDDLFNRLYAEKVVLPGIRGTFTTAGFEKDFLNLEEEAKETLRRAYQKLEENGIILIRSACYSKYWEGVDVLSTEKGGKLLLAKNYPNNGTIKKEDILCEFTSSSQAVWNYLAYGSADYLEQEEHEMIVEQVQKAGLPTEHLMHSAA